MKRKESCQTRKACPVAREAFQKKEKVNEVSEFININCKTVKSLLIYSWFQKITA